MAVSFEKAVIIGLGLIGGSLAAAFKRKGVLENIIGVDSEFVIRKAKEKKLINKGFEKHKLQEAVKDADLIILATPINQILKHLTLLPQFVKPGVLITDVGSTKRAIVETAGEHLPANVYFLGGHPMAGSEKTGLDHIDPFLFENAIYVLTNHSASDDLVKKYVGIIEIIGASVLFLTPAEHDEIAAVVSHLPQMLAVTLMNYAAKRNNNNPAYLKLAAGGFRDMTRIASSPFDVWADICTTNAENIEIAIEQLMTDLSASKNLLTENRQLLSFFETAARNRLSIPKDSRGFLRPQFDISVIIEDKPGMIASIAAILADEEINIKDIEILKMREGDAGTMRLAFQNETDREAALKLLAQKSFEVAKR